MLPKKKYRDKVDPGMLTLKTFLTKEENGILLEVWNRKLWVRLNLDLWQKEVIGMLEWTSKVTNSTEKRWKIETEKEAQKIHERVRKVIEKKEETIYKLLRYCDQATEKCQHLESQLERQAIQNYVPPKVNKLVTRQTFGPNSAQSYMQLPLTERFA